MIRSSRLLVVVTALFLAAFLGGCGNPLEGGSEPSGSVLRTLSATVSDPIQDVYFCEGEGSVEYVTATVAVRNDSTPNFEDSTTSPDGTNSFVTINRYRIDYAVLNMSAVLPGVDGGGFSLGLDKDQSGNLTIIVMPESVLQHIRSNYPTVGNGDAMEVRADITIWGTDAFQVDVATTATVTLTVDDTDPCTGDLPPADEQSL